MKKNDGVSDDPQKPGGFFLFTEARATEEDNKNDNFSRDFFKTFLTLEYAASEMGVEASTLLELGYQKRIFFVFPRPANVEIQKGKSWNNKSTPTSHDFGREFLVLPSIGCFSLMFRPITQVFEVEMALSFSRTHGFHVSDLNENIYSPKPEHPSQQAGFNRWSDSDDTPWDRWVFMNQGNRVSVNVNREDVYIHSDEVDLAQELLKNSTRDKVESFHSDDLQYLKQASRIFWGANSVVEDKTSTHPNNKKVAAWFEKNADMSPSAAKSAASLIRPNFAKAGRPTKPENDD